MPSTKKIDLNINIEFLRVFGKTVIKKHATNCETTVAIAAPFLLYLGIKIIFNITLTMGPAKVFNKDNLV